MGSVDEYMWHAADDLANATEMSSSERRHKNARAFHSQQAAEKAIKAAIATTGVEPRHVHDLVMLAGDMPAYQNQISIGCRNTR